MGLVYVVAIYSQFHNVSISYSPLSQSIFLLRPLQMFVMDDNSYRSLANGVVDAGACLTRQFK